MNSCRCLSALLLVSICLGCVRSHEKFSDFTTRAPVRRDDVLVLGFLGGRRPWNAAHQGVRQLALRLQRENIPGMHVETVENRRRDLALQLVHSVIDRNGDGGLSDQACENARIILYGQSFGGAAVIKFARQLEREGIPVLLTVQIDSVGLHDDVVPANVEASANLYQSTGLFVRGQPRIRAEDPSRTTILGNWRFDYHKRKIDISKVEWRRKALRRAHTKMNEDPEVWALVRELILQAAENEPATPNKPLPRGVTVSGR